MGVKNKKIEQWESRFRVIEGEKRERQGKIKKSVLRKLEIL